MPTYQYACDKCGRKFELQRSMADCAKEARCPNCGVYNTRRDYSDSTSWSQTMKRVIPKGRRGRIRD